MSRRLWPRQQNHVEVLTINWHCTISGGFGRHCTFVVTFLEAGHNYFFFSVFTTRVPYSKPPITAKHGASKGRTLNSWVQVNQYAESWVFLNLQRGECCFHGPKIYEPTTALCEERETISSTLHASHHKKSSPTVRNYYYRGTSRLITARC